MKKNLFRTVICLLLALTMVFGLTACKDKNKPNEDNTPSTPAVTQYTVTFNVQGHGTAPQAQTVDKDGKAVEPIAPTADGWSFEGWFKEAECTNKYDFATETVTKDITLFAKWTQKKTDEGGNNNGGGDDNNNGNPLDGLETDHTPTIYLAGDSTVQTYADAQYIAGWGQYLGLFLDSEVKVVNAARGGRSSRSFINEDRLFKDTDGTKYSFSENGGKSIEETIQEGDYLFVQFGHNDDATKGYQTMPDRMVPLGEPDENGIYPTTAPEGKRDKTYLPAEYTSQASSSEQNSALSEIAKYGPTYYAYGDGTYKWYLKQYIDLARSKGAIPVLLTPVARRSFNSDGTLKDGPGLHGDGFAYVKAVRQLAEEENCLLIDNFEYTKETLEKITPAFADFLLALVPNALMGEWPSGYDNAYNNPDAGYTGMENTHYNKYGAYLTAAYVAESIINSNDAGILKGSDSAKEYYNFASKVLKTPRGYIEPSNRVSISKVAEIEGMFDKVNPTNPNRTYKQPSEAIAAIEALQAKGPISSITEANYEQWKAYCAEARAVYESLNFDLRSGVTNYDVLLAYEEAVKAARPKPISTIVLCADQFTNVNTPITVGEHTFTFESQLISYAKAGAAFTYNDVKYPATSQSIRLNGNGKITTSSPAKYIEFTLKGACTVTIVASGGKAAGTIDETWRPIQMVDTANSTKVVATFDIPSGQDIVSNEIAKGGTYRIASGNSNIDVYYIIIEYYKEEGGTPEHNWAEEWSSDETHHWYDCLDENCNEKDGYEPHDFVDGVCVTCKYAEGEKELVSITAYDHTQNGSRVTQLLQKLFKVGDTFNYNNLSVRATSKVGSKEVTENVDISQVTVIAPDLSTAGEKTVTVKYGGKETTYTINVIDLSGVNKNEATVTVDPAAQIKANGNVVTVKSINDAVRVFKLLGTDDNAVKNINIVAGTHHEKVEFDIPNLHVKGASTDASKTIIEFDLIAEYNCPGTTAAYSTDGSATVSIRAGAIGFYAENITFQNYWNTHERYLQSKTIADALVPSGESRNGNTMAVACLIQADRCVFDNVRFSSYHDTLYDYNGRHVYNDCYIEGRTDYIFGYGATSLFNNCTLKTIGANDNKNGGYVCATMGYSKYTQSGQTPTSIIDYGYIFNGCHFTADSNVVNGTASLARAWSDYMTLAFINCDMSAAYSKTPYKTKTDGKNERYGEMTSGKPNAARLYEYGNTGDGALSGTDATVGLHENLCTILTEAQKDNFLNKNVIFAAVNGQIEYSSAWNGEPGVVVPVTFNFGDFPKGESTNTNEQFVDFFDGAISVKGTYWMNGSAMRLNAGDTVKINVQGKIIIDWFGSPYGTAANGKINYKNGYATLTIVADTNGGSANGIYIKSITVDATQSGIHVHEYGEWDVTTVPTTSTVGSASRTCLDCELETAHVQTVELPVLSEDDYTLGSSTNAGKAVYTYHSEYGDITFEADALAGVHVHHYGEWEVKEENKPTAEKTGLVTRTCVDEDCNHDETSTESKVLPALTDSAYTITDDTATVESGGEGTYTITIEGIDTPVSFTAATPRLTTTTFNFAELPNAGSTTYTQDNPAKPFGENKLSIVGTFRQQNGAAIQIVVGSVITLHMQGEITVVWWGGSLGTAANGRITYKNGYATLTIVEDAASTQGIYIKSITVDHTDIPEDTKYTVTFNSKGGSAVESAEVFAYEKVERPQDPTFEGYTFIGWYVDEACLQEFDFDSEITADTELFAKWKSNTVESHTVTVKVWNLDEGTVSVEDGETLTAAEVEALLATNGYKGCHAELYSDETLQTPYTDAVTADGTVYVKVIYDVDATINLLEYGGAQVQGGVAYWRGIKIDATSGKFSNNGTWVQFNANTALNFYVRIGTTATLTQNGGNITYAVDENGLATITTAANDYIKDFTLHVPPKAPTENVTYDWKGSENTKWQSKECIDSDSTDYIKFIECYSNGAQYFYINGDKTGASIQVMLPAGATLKLSGIYTGWGAATIDGKVYWNDDHSAADAVVEYLNDSGAAKLVIVTATKITNSYVAIEKVEIILPIVFKAGDSVDLLGSSLNLTAGQSAEYEGLQITAGTDKFQKNSTYVHVGAGSTISFKVAEGVTKDNIKVMFVDHQDNEGSYKEGTHFTLEIVDGVATITVGSSTMYIKSLKLVAKS